MPAASSTQRTRRRKWLFRAMALCFGLLLIPCIEMMLRVVGFGVETSLIIEAIESHSTSSDSPTHQLNGLSDIVYFGVTDLSGPEMRPFVLPKPDDMFRVLVLGESTVIGFPYAPELAFPRQMEVQLQAQMPDRRVEVLNAGITGINSFAIADLARQAVEADPDLVIIHAGHNEFYGPGGPGSSAFNYPPLLISQAIRARHYRLTQLFSGGYHVREAREDLLNVLPAQPNIERGSPTYIQGRENFRQNLSIAITHLQKASIRVLLVPTACNLRDQSPLLATWPALSSGRGEWRNLMNDAEQQMASNAPENALTSLRAAEKIVAEQAELQFRLGQCLQKLGKHLEARAAFEKARDLDNCRFRMPSEFAQVAEDVVRDRTQCWFYDLANGFESAGYTEAPGAELFLEHVHYTFEGHHVVAKLLSQVVVEECLSGAWDSGQVVEIETMKDAIGFVVEDDLTALSHALQVLETTPFRQCLDLQLQRQRLMDQIRVQYESLPRQRQNVYADIPFTALSHDITETLAAAHEAAKQSEEATFFRSKRQLRRPWDRR